MRWGIVMSQLIINLYELRYFYINLAYIFILMEENRNRKKKITNISQNPNDPTMLFNSCEEALIQLQLHMSRIIKKQNGKRIDQILPSLQRLQNNIIEIKQNVNKQITIEQLKIQKGALLRQKEKLQHKIQTYYKQIEKNKDQFRSLSVLSDQLINEYNYNLNFFKNQKYQNTFQQSKSANTTLDNSYLSKCSSETNYKMPKLNKSKGRLSITHQLKNIQYEDYQKWEKINELFDKISGLKTNGLSQMLKNVARQQKNGIKQVFKSYKTNDKMAKLLKKTIVKQQLSKLLRSIEK